MTSISPARWLLVVVLLVTIALAGCSTQKAGGAAIVGDSRLTETQVSDWIEELNELYDSNPDIQRPPNDQLSLAVVSWWLNEQVTKELAAREDITATPADVNQLVGSDEAQRTQLSGQNAIPPSQLEAAAEYVVLRQALGRALEPSGSNQQADSAYLEELRKVAADVGVSVSPRFGDWNPELPGLEARDTERLSSPAPKDAEPSTPAPSGQ